MDNQQLERLSKTFPSLIPLNGKVPKEKKWERWCKEPRPLNPVDFEACNAGLPCGPANGIIVIDVDHVVKFNKMCNAKGWDLPKTRMHQTGSGKPHYVYGYPENGKRFGNRSFKDPDRQVDLETGKIYRVFDIRGIGGQIVAPGSIHPETKQNYTVRYDLPIAPAPKWLLDLAVHDTTAIRGEQSHRGEWNRSIESLPVGYPIKRLISHGVEKNDRSEAIGSVLSALLKVRTPENVIFQIFDNYLIGEKYREKKGSRHHWLQAEIKRTQAFLQRNKTNTGRALTLSDLRNQFSVETRWLWRTHFPQGMPCMVNGREGSGKTTICLASAKEILEEHKKGSILWLATEGQVLDTINKMEALGLNERFYVAQKSDGTFKFDFWRQTDIRELDTILEDLPQPALAVYIDSIRGMSSLDDNDAKNGHIMHKMNALVCDRYRASLIYIDHHGKGKKDNLLDKSVGTTAKTAAVRLVLSVIQRTKYTRAITAAKSNIGPIPDLVSIQSAKNVTIEQPHEETEESLKTRSEQFLIDLFSEKKTFLATEIYALAEERGLSPDMLKKVKSQLGIKADRESARGAWLWIWPR